jgi:hypothetical protein
MLFRPARGYCFYKENYVRRLLLDNFFTLLLLPLSSADPLNP